MKEKLKKIFDIKFVKEHFSYYVLFSLLFLVILVFLLYFLLTKNISKIEINKLEKETSKYVNYIEDIASSDSKGIDRYIIYALDFSYYENEIDELSSKEISDFFKNYFSIELKEEDISNFGVNENMLEKNITYDSSIDKYKLNTDSKKDLLYEEIVYYGVTNRRKINKKKYTVTYREYIIENPLKLVDSILEENNKNNTIINLDEYKDYFKTGNVKKLKDFFNNNSSFISKNTKKGRKIRITYILDKNGEFIIYKIS